MENETTKDPVLINNYGSPGREVPSATAAATATKVGGRV